MTGTPEPGLQAALAALPAYGPDTPRPGLLAVLPRGETFRNFIYTGALDHVQAVESVAALSVLPNPELTQMLRDRFDVVLPLDPIPDGHSVRLTRAMLDLAHTRWLWSKGAQDRWRRRTLDATTPRARRRWALKKAVATCFANRTGLGWLSAVERYISRRTLKQDTYLRVMERLRPQVVFNTSHVHSENATHAVQAAQWLGIHTATFIYSWDNLTSQGRILLPYDSYLVWNEALKDGLRRLYPWIRPEQVFVTGTPQFDAHFQPKNHQSRVALCERIGADPERPLVVYATGMANHMPGEPDIVEGIANMLASGAFDVPQPQLVVRVYPKDTSGRFEALRTRRPDILFPTIPWEASWFTPLPADTSLLTNLLRHAAVGINVASTVALEHCMFDTPVVNVGYSPAAGCPAHLDYARYYAFDHYRPVVESGAVQVAWDPAQMQTLLLQAVQRPSARAPERRALLTRMFGDTLDGGSAARVAHVLLELVNRQRAGC